MERVSTDSPTNSASSARHGISKLNNSGRNVKYLPRWMTIKDIASRTTAARSGFVGLMTQSSKEATPVAVPNERIPTVFSAFYERLYRPFEADEDECRKMLSEVATVAKDRLMQASDFPTPDAERVYKFAI